MCYSFSIRFWLYPNTNIDHIPLTFIQIIPYSSELFLPLVLRFPLVFYYTTHTPILHWSSACLRFYGCNRNREKSLQPEDCWEDWQRKGISEGIRRGLSYQVRVKQKSGHKIMSVCVLKTVWLPWVSERVDDRTKGDLWSGDLLYRHVISRNLNFTPCIVCG